MFPLRSITRPLAIAAGFLKTTSLLAATLVVAVQTSDGRPLPDAVVTLRAREGGDHPAAPVSAIMDQVNRAFVPDLLVVPVGSTVEFPNSDSVSHQIYSFSPPKRFQLPLYRGRPYPPVRFEHTGVITLGCNIHDFMLAYVLVTDAPYFGRTDASGSWSVDLPRGTYQITVWHPRLREPADLQREITLADDRLPVSLRLTKSLQPAPLDSHHSWDTY